MYINEYIEKEGFSFIIQKYNIEKGGGTYYTLWVKGNNCSYDCISFHNGERLGLYISQPPLQNLLIFPAYSEERSSQIKNHYKTLKENAYSIMELLCPELKGKGERREGEIIIKQ